MIEDVREQFIKNLKHVKWMDDKTKEKAKEKVILLFKS